MPHRAIRLPVLPTAVAAASLLLTSCSAGSTTASSSSPSVSSTSSATGSIMVFAAASLQKTFTELGKQYEAAHPGTTIEFSFAGSSVIPRQRLTRGVGVVVDGIRPRSSAMKGRVGAGMRQRPAAAAESRPAVLSSIGH